MKTIVRAVSIAMLLGACGGASATPHASASNASASAQPLDGKAYDVTFAAPGEGSSPDTLTFAEGKFESSACTPLGFPKWTPYAASAGSDGTAFQVTTRHPSGTSMDWKGVVKSDGVEGTAARTMNGKTDTATFRGQLKK